MCSASQEIFHFWWNMKVRYCVQKNPPQVSILSLMNPVHTQPYFPDIHFNIILCMYTQLFKVVSSFQSISTKCLSFLPSVLHALPISSSFALTVLIIFSEDYKICSYSLCSFLLCPVTSFLLGPNIVLTILFSYTCNLFSSLSIIDQDSYPYKTTAKLYFSLCFSCFKMG